MQHQGEKSREFKGHFFCHTFSISKYELTVKDKVHLFCITAFLWNYEKIWRNYEGKKKGTVNSESADSIRRNIGFLLV